MISRNLALALAVVVTTWNVAPPAHAQTAQTAAEWPAWGRDPGGQRFSPLSTIDRGNVQTLKVAWTFRTGDAYEPKDSRPTAFEATPLYVDGTLYLSTPLGRILALDPVTGQQRWAYDASSVSTVSTAPRIESNAQTAAETASGTGWSLSVTSVMTPSVPSDPTKSRVRS